MPAKRTKALLRDHPTLVNGVLCALVAAQAGVAQRWQAASLLDPLIKPTQVPLTSDLYLAAAGLGGMTAGFAGVVIIFGLQSEGARFRRLRIEGGEPIRANWLSIISTPFVAAFLAVTSALLLGVDLQRWSLWTFELALLFLAHAAVRMIWVLGWLSRVVLASDRELDRNARTASSDDLLKGARVPARR